MQQRNEVIRGKMRENEDLVDELIAVSKKIGFVFDATFFVCLKVERRIDSNDKKYAEVEGLIKELNECLLRIDDDDGVVDEILLKMFDKMILVRGDKYTR